ncbi:acetyltransferase (GNAT) family protein [Desulfosporosinus acididurans]|uniref:Acetyltransferase (GNAT) family protein n=1 Tax=Desulfosporosinus acididurans TaxID=476652 RepID=A0A0J1FJS0_9FIRM|nr:GNAT family N-acetyltransferase [Desulfosporosinus acididurans]KLU63677.1 acetyltransferase (GNAT) family protein [Desulfosporosinus acididurans]
MRLDFLFDHIGNLAEVQESAIRLQLASYFTKHINNDFLAVLAETKDSVISTAFLVVDERPANPIFTPGKTGTLLNVFTYPKCRRMGFAKKVIESIIEEAKQLGVSSIDLLTTQDGKPLYEKLGFTTYQLICRRVIFQHA